MPAAEEKSQRIKPILRIILPLVAIAALWLGLRLAFPNLPTLLAGMRPESLGVSAGKLAPCPSTPNCVSSQSQDAPHSISPLTYEGSPQQAMAELTRLIQQQPRVKLVAAEANYLAAEFTSRWLGFVDDVEFYLNEGKGAIEVRSASRLGESDLGANRQRIESLRSQFSQLDSRR